MIDNPWSCTSLGSLASWGLLNFLSSYNIVSELDTKEIFRIFGTIPRKQQRNHSVIFKGLGLADRIPGTVVPFVIVNNNYVNTLLLIHDMTMLPLLIREHVLCVLCFWPLIRESVLQERVLACKMHLLCPLFLVQ